MKGIRFRPEVADDLRDAYAWYAERSKPAADRFVAQLEAVFERVERSPSEFPVVYRELRRALVRRYPYAVFFLVDPDTVIVVGVLHQAVHPRAWQDRA